MAAVETRLRHSPSGERSLGSGIANWARLAGGARGLILSYRLAARTSAGRGSRRRGLGEFCFARFFDAEPDRVKCG
jgi:hypothetical protein